MQIGVLFFWWEYVRILHYNAILRAWCSSLPFFCELSHAKSKLVDGKVHENQLFSRAHHFKINFVVNFANFQVVSMIGSEFVVDLSQPLSFAAVFHLLHVASFRSIAAGFSSTQPSTTPVIAAVPCRSAIRIFAFLISEAPWKLRAIATFKLLSSWKKWRKMLSSNINS